MLPTTTIGSLPQTAEVRNARASFASGKTGQAEYDSFLRAETARAIRWQEEIGIDVLVHGEFERNDMVQYFAEQLDGYAFTSRRVGPELRLPLRPPTDHPRRHLTTGADDRHLVDVRPVAHRAAGQRDAHRPRDDDAVVVRP